VDISNLLGQALGLPLIKSGNHHGHGKVIGTPNILHLSTPAAKMQMEPLNLLASKYLMMVTTMDTAHGRHHKHNGHHLGKGWFINRIHYSIMNLGCWEGRAVAFVRNHDSSAVPSSCQASIGLGYVFFYAIQSNLADT